jgi:hypothetical protein
MKPRMLHDMVAQLGHVERRAHFVGLAEMMRQDLLAEMAEVRGEWGASRHI